MSNPDELRAKAQQLLKQANAAAGSSDSIVFVMRSVEFDTQADLLEAGDIPEPYTVSQQTSG
jgi:hypothetical protein